MSFKVTVTVALAAVGIVPLASYSLVPIAHQRPSVLVSTIVLVPLKVTLEATLTLRTTTGINAFILQSVITALLF